MSPVNPPTPEEFRALVKTEPVAAWEAVAPWLRTPLPKAAEPHLVLWLAQLGPHGAKLPAAWRQALIAMLADEDNKPSALLAIRRAPHPDYVPAMLAEQQRIIEDKRVIFAGFGEVFGQPWNDAAVTAVLAQFADARAVPVLEALFVQADKLTDTQGLLDAAAKTKSPALVPALRAWVAKREPGTTGTAAQVIAELEAIARETGQPLPERPSIEPVAVKGKGAKKKSAPAKKKPAPAKKKPAVKKQPAPKKRR